MCAQAACNVRTFPLQENLKKSSIFLFANFFLLLQFFLLHIFKLPALFYRRNILPSIAAVFFLSAQKNATFDRLAFFHPFFLIFTQFFTNSLLILIFLYYLTSFIASHSILPYYFVVYPVSHHFFHPFCAKLNDFLLTSTLLNINPC